MFSMRHRPKRYLHQDVFLDRISQFQTMHKDRISVVVVPNPDSSDQRGISYKVTREAGLAIQAAMEQGKRCHVVVRQKKDLKVYPVIVVNNTPTYHLGYAMRWVYHVMVGSQFDDIYAQELAFVDKLGG